MLMLVYLLAAYIGGVAAFVIWKKQHAPAGRPLALTVMAAAFWAFCDAIEISVTGVEAKRLVSQLQYLSVTSMVPLFFHAALALSRLEKHLTRAALWAIWGVPAATLAIAWTSQWHPWLWKAIVVPDPESNLTVYVYGWWFWILTAQNYMLMVVGTTLLLRATRRVSSPFRGPLFLVVMTILLPWAGNIAYVFKLGPWPGLNWLSISVIASGTLFAWLTLRGGLLDLLPRAREALVERMIDGVVVLDHAGRILLHNSAAREIFDWKAEAAALPQAVLQHLQDPGIEIWQEEIPFSGPGAARWLEVRATAVHDRWGEVAGRLLVVRDITGQKALAEEKEKLIAELRTALNDVRTLQGLLPICASCKKIRDDKGYWNQIENYLLLHAQIRFTHGICPDCARKLYPEPAAPQPPRGS